MEYLFLCSKGIDRSPTAVEVAEKIAKERGLELKAVSYGIDKVWNFPDFHLRIYFDTFDKIFVMEQRMKERVIKTGYPEERVHCLNITGDYVRGQAHLVAELEILLKDLL